MSQARLSDEHGFSLIELMVVVVVIAVLIGIAIPVYLGFRERAQDTASKESAVLAIRTAMGLMEDEGYALITAAVLSAAEPSLTFLSTSSSGSSVVSVDVPDASSGGDIFVAAVFSSSDKCFFVRDLANAGSSYALMDPGSVAACRADNTGSLTFEPSW